MAFSVVSDACSGFKGLDLGGGFCLPPGPPHHETCTGGQTTPGVLGGWICSCDCHRHRFLEDQSFGAARCACGWRSTWGWTLVEIPGQYNMHVKRVLEELEHR